ncbi:unnamed protein product, partial [Phaeothamnion confervicola]
MLPPRRRRQVAARSAALLGAVLTVPTTGYFPGTNVKWMVRRPAEAGGSEARAWRRSRTHHHVCMTAGLAEALPVRIAFIGAAVPPDVIRQLASRYNAEAVFLEEILRGRRGPRTDKVIALAVASRLRQATSGWVLSGGFPATAAQATLLEQGHDIRIDRLVLGVPFADHDHRAATEGVGSDAAKIGDQVAALGNAFEGRVMEIVVEQELADTSNLFRAISGLVDGVDISTGGSGVKGSGEEARAAASSAADPAKATMGAAPALVAERMKPAPAARVHLGGSAASTSPKDAARNKALEGALQRREQKKRRKVAAAAAAAAAAATAGEAAAENADGGRTPFYAAFVGGGAFSAVESATEKNGASGDDDGFDEPLGLFSPAASAAHDHAPMSFGGLLLPPPMAARLTSAGILSPTLIQEAAMMRIAAGESVIMHAATGSGKTLAYLLPLLTARQAKGTAAAAAAGAGGRLLVVVPTRELCVQTAREVVLLSGGDMAAADLVVDAPPPLLSSLRAPIVVGTAKLLAQAVAAAAVAAPGAAGRSAAVPLAGFGCVVLDEVDRLLDPPSKYAADARQQRRHVRPAAGLLQTLAWAAAAKGARAKSKGGGGGDGGGPGFQVVACSATVGRPLRRELARLLGVKDFSKGPAVIREEEDGADGTAASRIGALLDSLRALRPRAPLVFVPPGERVQAVVAALQAEGFSRALALHEALGFASGHGSGGSRRTGWALSLHDGLAAAFARVPVATAAGFVSDGGDATADGRGVGSSSNSAAAAAAAAAPILVTSAESARGLHFDNVDFVFLLGRPKGPDDYIHLAGRTGRQGRPGAVVSIVTYREARGMSAWEAALRVCF